MIKKYVKKPIPIEAVQWTGMNRAEIMNFCHDARLVYHEDENEPVIAELYIHTLEGDMHANHGDYIVRGLYGEFYPVKGEIFEKTYEEIK